MGLVEVEITGMAITSRYGALTSGTILRTDAAFAKHLVEDCGAAKYVDQPVSDQAAAEKAAAEQAAAEQAAAEKAAAEQAEKKNSKK